MINLYKLIINAFGPENVLIHDQCIIFYQFQLFLATFPSIILLYSSVFMYTIDCIKCQREKKTEKYAFASSMFNKNSLKGNQLIFKDLNVVQIDIKKDDN